MSANGLTAKEEKALNARHAQMEALYGRRAHMGHQEHEPIRLLMADIRVRLNPPTPAELEAEAQQYLDLYRDYDWFEATMKDIAA